ncbi:bifunctional folylpolyglutamate synthase/dihydrofolate synthase [Psychrilyobacter atlanticus]|uniref:bifunctional folylpolyglutamate synthase/dihydrofolate synthase n=1 Tax=Psychrilyobacter atlanticus TaxID=271091 RepID=UPI00041D18DA|nr:folylpolyglutamate synthase/dihydrofolate synthase family protein [Psychrilyobacter atlanticus]
MNIDKTLEELYSLTNMGIKLGLDNIKNILKLMGNPQDNYKILHIAGTNGKGSTATILEASLLEAGYKVGKYTSPHIEKFNERIVVNREQISDERICSYYKKIRTLIEVNDLHPTFFEITTAMMFDYFKDCGCEYVVLETGLGGRFDATNVCHPEISIITNISMDHINILGDNLTDIAREKCGIIKDSPVVIADSKPELITAVEKKTKDYVDVLKKYRNVKFELTEDFGTTIYIDNMEFNLSLYGEYQINNFLGAYEALKKIGISNKNIQDAVSKVFWPGRFEIYSKEDPIVILDGAHNVDAASRLKENILSKYRKNGVVTLVSILEDKDRDGILEEISKFSDEIIFTSLEDFHRGTSGSQLLDLVSDFKDQIVEDNLIKAFELAKKTKKVIVICGSFYLLSKFKKSIQMR